MNGGPDRKLFRNIRKNSGGVLFEQLPGLAWAERVMGRLAIGRGAEDSSALATFFPTSYCESTLTQYFEIEKIVPRGLHGHQYFSVVRKKSSALNRLAVYLEYLQSLEEGLFRLGKSGRLTCFEGPFDGLT